ncbi:MAG: hypothetical protein AB1351_11720 [Thermoproteota archaeon]
MQLEYVNPLAGLAMLVIGLFVMIFIHWMYGVTPAIVGLVLVIYYRKYLFQILGTAY